MSAVRTFGGRYEVIESAGAGGMAEVYRARDTLLGREVAVKVLNPQLSHDRQFVERFRREAQTAAALNHPNIVSLFDFGEDSGTYFIVMEFIDGRTLADIIAEGPLMPERAAEIASDVAKGLGRAHSAGLVHRDVKPSNIMITDTGTTKVTDFGIARALSTDSEATMTQTGMVIGTASYLSPEQAQGRPVDARSDVYSLGCVLHEMLTGHAPFEGDTPLSIAYKHVREEPPRPSMVNSDVPESLDAVVMKAMSKNPDNRYHSSTEMGEDLDRFLAGHKVAATPFLNETSVMGGGTQVMDGTAIYEREEPPPEDKGRGWRVALVTLLVLGLLGLLAYLVADNLFGESPQARVPRVVGLEQATAENRLENAGFTVAVEEGANRRDAGRVFRQDPEPGEQIDEGSEVTIFVSTGPGEAEVPDLIGQTEDQARTSLENAGLELGDVSEAPSDEADEGEIFDQSPDAGRTVEAGSAVDITVASGPETVEVPNVIGMSEEDAVSTIEDAGLTAEVGREASDAEEGTVFAQEPTGGSSAEPGDTVRIVVSEGEEEQPLPDVTGQDADDAQESLEEDFGLSVSQEEGACAQPPGTVCETDPEPGTPVSEGDSVVLFVVPGG